MSDLTCIDCGRTGPPESFIDTEHGPVCRDVCEGAMGDGEFARRLREELDQAFDDYTLDVRRDEDARQVSVSVDGETVVGWTLDETGPEDVADRLVEEIRERL